MGNTRCRVVVTGMGAVSPFGEGVSCLLRGLTAGRRAILPLPPEQDENGRFRFGALAPQSDAGRRIPRAHRRTMSAMSVHACLAGEEALRQADFAVTDDAGIAFGSTLAARRRLRNSSRRTSAAAASTRPAPRRSSR